VKVYFVRRARHDSLRGAQVGKAKFQPKGWENSKALGNLVQITPEKCHCRQFSLGSDGSARDDTLHKNGDN
jgi:hypothetical protein